MTSNGKDNRNKDSQSSSSVAVSDSNTDGAKSSTVMEEKSECMGCQAVAFTTPLLISAYLIHQHSTLEKVAAMPVAQTWTGSRRWRLKMHRFNMMFTAPVGFTLVTWSYLFNGLPTAAEEQANIESLDDLVQRTVESSRSEIDGFTRGTLKLADWFTSSLTERKSQFSDWCSRLKRTFSSESVNTTTSPGSPSANNSLAANGDSKKS